MSRVGSFIYTFSVRCKVDEKPICVSGIIALRGVFACTNDSICLPDLQWTNYSKMLFMYNDTLWETVQLLS